MNWTFFWMFMAAMLFWRLVWILIQYAYELVRRHKDHKMDAYFRDRFKN